MTKKNRRKKPKQARPKTTNVGLFQYLTTMAEQKSFDGVFYTVVATPTVIRLWGWQELEELCRSTVAENRHLPEHFIDPKDRDKEGINEKEIPIVVNDPGKEGGVFMLPFRHDGIPFMGLALTREAAPDVVWDWHYNVKIGHYRAKKDV